MPIPKPSKGETPDDFHSRCMSSISDEYGQEQANAICYSAWRKGEENIITPHDDEFFLRGKHMNTSYEIKEEVQIGNYILEKGDKFILKEKQ